MAAALPLLFAVLLVLCWLGGWGWLRWHRTMDESALRVRLRQSHPRDDLAEISDLERMAQPFSPEGVALYEQGVRRLHRRYVKSQSLLAAIGLASLLALIVLARSAL